MTLRKQVGLRVAELRRAAGLSQDDLAAKIDKSSQSVSQMERGAIAPSFDTVEALARALKVGPALLFPATLTGKRPTARDETLSAIIAGAAQLSKSDADTLRVIVDALLARKTER